MSSAADRRPDGEECPVPGSPDLVLAAARSAVRMERCAAAAKLMAAVEWAALHEPTDTGDAAFWWESCQMIPLAGEGAPLIGEYAVAEFATALGVSTDAGRRVIGQALELCYRLPKLWAGVQSGEVAAWRATRVAEQTMTLSRDAAGFVDRQVAVAAGRVSIPQLEHLVTEARVRHEAVERPDPDDPCPAGPDRRRVQVHLEEPSFDGTVALSGELDLPDALALDAALAAGAEQLRLAGSVESLGARRAVALGEMARDQLALTYEAADQDGTPRPSARRDVTLYLHVAEEALDGAGRVGRCENTRSPVDVEAVRAWCGHPDAKITVKPVLDLAAHVRVDQYELPDRLKAQVDQLAGHCVFPWCSRPARGCDHDHAIPYDAADPDCGPTCTCNVAPLCRHHHRIKTHTPWRYLIVEPGVYAWTSPHGYRLLVDHTGTRDVTSASTALTGGCGCVADPPDQ